MAWSKVGRKLPTIVSTVEWMRWGKAGEGLGWVAGRRGLGRWAAGVTGAWAIITYKTSLWLIRRLGGVRGVVLIRSDSL